MDKQDVVRLRNMLLERHKEVTDRVRQLEAGWQDLKERSIELVEEAQKANITEAYDRLDDNATDEIEQIELALSRMSTGDYGICESCGDDIEIKRLEALPSARLCIDCARNFEKKRKTLPASSEVMGSAKLPEEYQGLTGEQVIGMIFDHLRSDDRLDTEELKISLRKGVLYLEGSLPGEVEHQIVIQTLTDVLGFPSVVDQLEINELAWEREDRTPDEPPERTATKDRLIYSEEEISDDLYEAQDDETPYSPPDRPLQQEDERKLSPDKEA